MATSTETQGDVRWDLSPLYAGPDDPRIADDLSRASSEAAAFAERYRGRVASLSPTELREALETLEAFYQRAYRPSFFASLAFAGQTDDPKLQALLVNVRESLTETMNQIVFFDIELKTMAEEAFQALLASETLAPYHHFLRAVRKFAPHTLSEPEERLMAQMRLTGAAAWDQLYTEITSALRFPVEINGEVKQLTDAEVRALRTHPDREVRKRAFRTLGEVYSGQQQVLTFIFNTLFQDHKIVTHLRRYRDPIEPTALDNELSIEVIETLMATTEANYGLAQEYYRLKAKQLGLEGDFHYYDTLAPLTREEPHYSFDQGRDMVLEAFASFHPLARETAERFFSERKIDAFPRPGKRGGAFCAGLLPGYHPYVLTNFNHRIDDVFTLAHELGHGIHFSLAGQRQTVLNYDISTPMAEVASVFAEMLLAAHLRERAPDPTLRRIIVANMVEDAIATVFRQVMYTRWEQRAHARRAAGVATADEYSGLWMEEVHRLYGDAVQFEEIDRWFWIGVPHFVHSRFYCFSYAFGHLLTFALYQKYLEEGPGFAPRYLELLASGGKESPEVLLEGVGLGPLDRAFWQKGFDVLRRLLDEYRVAVGT